MQTNRVTRDYSFIYIFRPDNESAAPAATEGQENGQQSKPASRAPSQTSGAGIKSPEPVTSDNPAADLRNMRRIIAEDNEWSLMTVPLLWELCITHIVENFESKYNYCCLSKFS